MQQQYPHHEWNNSKWRASNRRVFKVSTRRRTLNYDGFDINSEAFVDLFSRKWTLKSLTIGPQRHQDIEFWLQAFKDLPPLPCVDNVTIIYHYRGINAFNTASWRHFDRMLARRDLFPALKSVHIRSSYGPHHVYAGDWWSIYCSFQEIRGRGLGLCKLLAFEKDQGTDPPYAIQIGTQRLPKYQWKVDV